MTDYVNNEQMKQIEKDGTTELFLSIYLHDRVLVCMDELFYAGIIVLVSMSFASYETGHADVLRGTSAWKAMARGKHERDQEFMRDISKKHRESMS